MIQFYIMLTVGNNTKTISKVDSPRIGKIKAQKRMCPPNASYWIGEYRNGILVRTWEIN